MSIPRAFKLSLFGLSVSFGLCYAKEKPNIVWLFSDDHAVNAIDAYGGRLKDENITPNLNALAAEGMIFERAYVANSLCAPSRATLLTGKHSHINGKLSNSGRFNHDQNQFQKVIKKAGYQTAIVGKIHLKGALQGFDYWEVFPGQGEYENPSFETNDGEKAYQGHSSDIIVDLALDWLESGRDERPFMLMVHFKAPHHDWMPAARNIEEFKDRTFPEPDSLFDDYSGRGAAARSQHMSIEKAMPLDFLKVNEPEFSYRAEDFESKERTGRELVSWKYQAYMRDYLACVAGIDQNIGRMLRYLEEHGLEENTIVMYSSDQGFYLGEHGWYDKRFMYEESFRTPLIARWPGKIEAGSKNSDLVQNIDFAETFLDLAGAPIPDDMQGVSLLPLLKGKTPDNWRTSLYYHYYEPPRGFHKVFTHEGVSTKRYKLIRFYGQGVPNGEEWELYDLVKDPSEMKSEYDNPEYNNVIETLKSELTKLKKKYKEES